MQIKWITPQGHIRKKAERDQREPFETDPTAHDEKSCSRFASMPISSGKSLRLGQRRPMGSLYHHQRAGGAEAVGNMLGLLASQRQKPICL